MAAGSPRCGAGGRGGAASLVAGVVGPGGLMPVRRKSTMACAATAARVGPGAGKPPGGHGGKQFSSGPIFIIQREAKTSAFALFWQKNTGMHNLCCVKCLPLNVNNEQKLR